MEGKTQATLEDGELPLILRLQRVFIDLQLLLRHLAAAGLVGRIKSMVKQWSLMPTNSAITKHRIEDRM